MTKPKLRKNAEINPPQSPHDGIHTCSNGCKKPGCTRTLRDTIEEQNQQIEALNRDVLEKTAENARLKAEVERLTAFTTRTIIPNEELQAQVERLTKAGDAMENWIAWVCESPVGTAAGVRDAWDAAKEGKQS